MKSNSFCREMEITSSEGSYFCMVNVVRIAPLILLAKLPWGGGIMIYRVEGVGEWKRKNKESS